MPKIIAVFLIALAAVLGGYYLYSNRQLPNVPIFSSPTASSENTLTLPVNPNQPGVYAMSLVYTFTAQLTEIKQEGENLILKLDPKISQDFPIFVATPTTSVFRLTNEVSTPASLTDLKVGQYLILPTAYFPEKNNWQVQSVIIQE